MLRAGSPDPNSGPTTNKRSRVESTPILVTDNEVTKETKGKERIAEYLPIDCMDASEFFIDHLYNHHASAKVKASAFLSMRELAEDGYKHYFQCEKNNDAVSLKITDDQGEVLFHSVLQEKSLIPDNVVPDETDAFRLAQAVNSSVPVDTGRVNTLPHIDRLVVLGDSLSDSEGRMYEKSFGFLPSGDQYYQGQFTNGNVWSKLIASPGFLNKPMLNLAEGGSVSANYGRVESLAQFAKDPLHHGTDLGLLVVSNMDTQMSKYSSQSTDLVIISLGANDYMTFEKSDVNCVIDNQVENIKKLLNNGVKNILVCGVPDMSLTPYAKHLEKKGELERLHNIVSEHNQQLADSVGKIQCEYPETTVVFLILLRHLMRY